VFTNSLTMFESSNKDKYYFCWYMLCHWNVWHGWNDSIEDFFYMYACMLIKETPIPSLFE